MDQAAQSAYVIVQCPMLRHVVSCEPVAVLKQCYVSDLIVDGSDNAVRSTICMLSAAYAKLSGGFSTVTCLSVSASIYCTSEPSTIHLWVV